MTYLEVDKALLDITIEAIKECQDRVNGLPKESKNERKALMVELGMYQFCRNAGFLGGTTGARENVINGTRARVIERILQSYPEINKIFVSLDEDERKVFIAALQAEIYIRDQWLPEQYTSLAAAEESGDAKNAFEFRIKIGAAENIFSLWEEWRVQNNVFPGLLEEGLR